jgi:translation initiation factor 2 beta subunit (eIF-2beta)/eIF-5
MEKFINEVLLCPGCGLPEVNLSVDKKEVMGLCRACGANSKMNITNFKFKNYIINHPPTQSGSAFSGNKAE